MKANGVISNKIPLPYNSYNVFYILERERIIHERNGKQTTREESSDCDFNWYGSHLEVPSLPPRYIHLESTLAPNWYIPGARKLAKRKHVKSHGVASFREISRIVADNWKTLEPTTQQYCQAVASILKERHVELTQELQQNWHGEEGPKTIWSSSQTNPTAYQEMMEHQQHYHHQATPSPSSITIHRPNMNSVLPENNVVHLPYCGECDYYSNPYEPLPLMPSTMTASSSSSMIRHHPHTAQTNHATGQHHYQETVSEEEVLQMYLNIAASVSSQNDVYPPSGYNANDESIFCGECTH